MQDVFARVVPWATIAFSVSSMLAVGLAHAPRDIVSPLRRVRRVLRSLASNFVLSPLWAFLLLRLFRLEESHAIGLFLVGAAAGAPFLVKLVAIARADVAFSGSLLLLLVPGTVLFLSVVLPIAFPEIDLPTARIAAPLALFLLLPFGAGMAVRALAPRPASVLQRATSRFSTAAIVVLFSSIVLANLDGILGIGGRALAAAFVFELGAFVFGWWFGARMPGAREVVALGTAQRGIAAATVVATQSFGDRPGVIVMVTTAAVVAWIVLFPIAFALRGMPLARRRPA